MFDLLILKGYFPHGFNTPENQNYVGPFPDESFLETKFMTEDRYASFKKWYDAKHTSIRSGVEPQWNFKEEILKYCENDVDVLMQAWLLYQKKMFDITGMICPQLLTQTMFGSLHWMMEPSVSYLSKTTFTMINHLKRPVNGRRSKICSTTEVKCNFLARASQERRQSQLVTLSTR